MTGQNIRDEVAYLRDEAAILMDMYVARPLLRGVSHLVGCLASLGAMIVLIFEAGAALQMVGSAIFGAGLTAALGVSALYHRIRWRPRGYHFIRKLDHSMIFVLIASSYTPILLLALDGGWRIAALALVWGTSLTAVVLRMSVKQLPRFVMVGLGLGLGWGALSLFPALHALSDTALVLVMASGGLYTLGALAYLTRKPNPFPRFFGFHEVFHAFVVAGATLHYVAIWPLVTA